MACKDVFSQKLDNTSSFKCVLCVAKAQEQLMLQ